jgi:dihydrofolate reductase
MADTGSGTTGSRVTIHMAASLDGFIARRDGRVDWMEVQDRFEGGTALTPEASAAVLRSIHCYVMGANTYETALGFEARGFGWAYGDTPVVVLTHRSLRQARPTVSFHTGDLGELLAELRTRYQSIWIAGGGAVCGEALSRGLADELRYAILPVVIGDGVPFFAGLDRDVALHLLGTTAYDTGMVSLHYEIRR